MIGSQSLGQKWWGNNLYFKSAPGGDGMHTRFGNRPEGPAALWSQPEGAEFQHSILLKLQITK